MTSPPRPPTQADLLLIDSYPDALIATSADGVVLAWSSAAEQIFGYTRGEAIGQRLVDLIVPPEAFAESRQQMVLALRTGRANYECQRRRKDGTLVHVHSAVRVVYGDRDEVRYVTLSKRDITLARHLREAQVIEQRFRGLLEAAPDAMVIVNQDGRIVLTNSQLESLFGYGSRELLGQSLDTLVPERYRGRHHGHRAAYFREPRSRPMGASLELFGRRADGTEFPVEISLSPMETDQGTLVTAAIRDITERKRHDEARRQAEELIIRQAQEANRLKSEFLANMSHELRTPLNAIIGFAELMHDGRVGPVSADHREYLADILTSSRHLLQLINDVLDLAKVEAGRMEFHPQKLDPAAVVGEVCDTLRRLASLRRIEVTVVVDPSVPVIELDSAKLKQVLYNYLSNALKFTPEEGRVTVRIAPEGDSEFRLEVEDSGVGIPVQDHSRLFVEFQQLDSGAAKKHQGTGLGLALTRRIVEAQGGRVGVQSAPGRGSLFYAILPRTVNGIAPAELRRAR